MPSHRRVNVRGILADPDLRRQLMVPTIQAIQAREGIDTTTEQAERAYYVVTQAERATFFALDRFKPKDGQPDRRHEMFVRALRDELSDVRSEIARRDFAVVEGSPLAFGRISTLSPIFSSSVRLQPGIARACTGLSTGSEGGDARFLRMRWEIEPLRVGPDRDWRPYAKGGEFSRFYADLSLVVFWRDDGAAIKSNPGSAVRCEGYYGKEGVTWTQRSQRGISFRYLPSGSVFAAKGPSIFPAHGVSPWVLQALLNSRLIEFVVQSITSFGSYQVGAVQMLPIAPPGASLAATLEHLARLIHDAKRDWDRGNEPSTVFDLPWVLRAVGAPSLSSALDSIGAFEAKGEERNQSAHEELNEKAYALYGIHEPARAHIERSLGTRPAEILWTQMEGKSTEQKRMEHVWRLLSYAVKRVVEKDDDGIVPFNQATGETRLVGRVRQELASLLPSRDESQLEVEIVNELKRGAKGYRKCTSLEEWLANVFFEYHASLYKNRPIFWHIASSQGTAPFAFGILVHYHRFDKNRMAKLRASYVRDTIEELRREAGLADKAGRAEDRVELQAKLEEVQTLDRKLQQIQEGHLDGPEGGDRDFRILTPWKDASARPRGWEPDIDDGVKVNIAPLDRAGVLRVTGVAG